MNLDLLDGEESKEELNTKPKKIGSKSSSGASLASLEDDGPLKVTG